MSAKHHDIAETIVCTAATLRFNVITAPYKLESTVNEAVAQHHRSALKASGFRSIAEAYRAAIQLAPKHPAVAQWHEDLAAAQTEARFYGEAAAFWIERF
jgi:hypothetical protein